MSESSQRPKRCLNDTTIDAVISLYKHGKSIEEIARIFDVTKETVHDILAGEYSLNIERRKIKPRRCPNCGNMINIWPCVECVQTKCRPLVPPLEDTDDQQHLSGSEQQRYNDVRHWRIVYGHPSYNKNHPLHRDTTKKSDDEEK